jgi:hypothetical protein
MMIVMYSSSAANRKQATHERIVDVASRAIRRGGYGGETVMTAENMVDAALAGLDLGEGVTLPSVADTALFQRYEAARVALFTAAQTGKVAPHLQKR